MRISPITATTNYTQRKQTIFNTHQQHIVTSFKAKSKYEQEVEARTEEIIREQNMSGWKQFWGGEEKARQQAIAEIDKKNQQNEIENIKNKAINEVLNERIKDSNEYMKKIEEQQRKNDKLMNEFKKAHSQTILIQKEALATQKTATDSLKSQIENYQKIVKEQQEIQAKRTKEVNELITKLTEAREKQDAKIVEMFEKELKNLKDFYNKQLNAKAAEAEKVRHVEDLFQKMNKIQSNKGFGRIAGYQDIKDVLISIVGNSIILEKDGQNIAVPNGILFFGPKGNGKTTFAQAFAEQLDCNIVKIENMLDPAENLKSVRKEAEKGKKLFEEKGIRTILQIDEFDEFAPKGDKIVGPLKALFDNISNDYHCTFFLTTNYPERIDTILMRDGRLDVKVPLTPADKNNIMEILNFYGKPFADNTVDFEALADLVLSYLPEASYSNARLKSVVESFIKEHNVTKMSQKDFITSIKNIRPDITKEALKTFNKQVELMKHV